LNNLIYTGNPIREDIYDGNRKRGIEEFGLSEKLPTIMIIGGSQGALAINQLISEVLTVLLAKYQIIHVSGERDYDWLLYKSQQLDKSLAKNYHLHNFLSSSLKDAYAVSDLVISRAGNNVIAELAALAKPTILIPLSTSANDHQLVNAQILSQAGAAVLMLQEHLSSKKLSRQIDILFERPDELESMAKNIEKFAKKDAAEAVAKEIINLAKEYQKNEIQSKE
jgi:UDP-N-acetylglucosamine--N-acetylmuramyl-(pentapeptide) pyrophosphoryl-undecaprenol N-acetylglucosamine transferase